MAPGEQSWSIYFLLDGATTSRLLEGVEGVLRKVAIQAIYAADGDQHETQERQHPKGQSVSSDPTHKSST